MNEEELGPRILNGWTPSPSPPPTIKTLGSYLGSYLSTHQPITNRTNPLVLPITTTHAQTPAHTHPKTTLTHPNPPFPCIEEKQLTAPRIPFCPAFPKDLPHQAKARQGSSSEQAYPSMV